jgi:hypothetical protein
MGGSGVWCDKFVMAFCVDATPLLHWQSVPRSRQQMDKGTVFVKELDEYL